MGDSTGDTARCLRISVKIAFEGFTCQRFACGPHEEFSNIDILFPSLGRREVIAVGFGKCGLFKQVLAVVLMPDHA